MKIAVVLVAGLSLASACKKKEAAKPATGSAGSAVMASDAAVSPEPAGGPAVLEQQDVDAESVPELAAAFGKQMPKLPAINADGTLLATLDDVSGGPAIPPAMQVTIRKFPSGDKVEELPVLTYEEASNAGETGGDQWLTPELAKQLGERGKAIVAKLAGFHTLHEVKLEQVDGSSYDIKPTKVGDLVFTAKSSDTDTLTLALQTAQGKTIHREQIDAYTERETGGPIDAACPYQPVMSALWTDPPKPRALYVETRYRYRDDCGAPDPSYFVWSTDPNSTTPAEMIADLVSRQLDVLTDDDNKVTPDIMAADALFIDRNIVDVPRQMQGIGPGYYEGQHDDKSLTITMSHDGKSAWASFFTTLKMGDTKHGEMPLDKRVSDFIVQTPQGWRIAARAWTDDVENATANKDAKAGKVKAEPLKPEPGDASLNAAFAKLTTDGATNVDKDIVAIGSGPGERTVGAPAFVKPWNAAWKGKTTIVSSIARLAPSGTTGWVAATVELQKTGYKIPFTVFAVFDKDASGAWTLVHIHFAA